MSTLNAQKIIQYLIDSTARNKAIADALTITITQCLDEINPDAAAKFDERCRAEFAKRFATECEKINLMDDDLSDLLKKELEDLD